MTKKMTWEDICAELGEKLNLSYGKVEELLQLIVTCLKYEYKLSRKDTETWIINMASKDWQKIENMFQKARDGRADMERFKSKVESDRRMNALHNQMKSIYKFLQQHGGVK